MALLPVLAEDNPPVVAGRPGLTQGRYGERGNLELVVPDPVAGIWVFWFNADAVDSFAGPPPGRWSGGLRFFGGARVVSAQVSQVRGGPDYLEVLALTDDARLHRLYWTPTDGFLPAGEIAREVAAHSQLVEGADGSLHVLVADRSGRVAHLSTTADGYPHVTWTSRPLALRADTIALATDGSSLVAAGALGGRAVRARLTAAGWQVDEVPLPGRWQELAFASADHVIGIDAEGRLAHLPLGGAVAVVDDRAGHTAVAAARTTLEGGRLDVVVMRGGFLAHGWADPEWTRPEPVRCAARVPAGTTQLHRPG